MQDLMMEIVDKFGYIGIFLLIFIENVFPPIPSEAVLLFGGALTVNTSMNVIGTIIAATIGSVVGAIALYFVGRVFKAEQLKQICVGKIGKVLHLKPEYVDNSVEWFSKYGGRAVLICRCVPLIRSLISIPAGLTKMNMSKFLIYTVLGSSVWNTILVFIGAGLGMAWESALPYLDKYTNTAGVIIAGAAIVAVAWCLTEKDKKQEM